MAYQNKTCFNCKDWNCEMCPHKYEKDDYEPSKCDLCKDWDCDMCPDKYK